MRYCPDCHALCSGEKHCPYCGSGRLRPVREDDPVLLINASREESGPILGALSDAGVPYLEKAGGVSGVVLGSSRSSGIQVYVPFGALSRSTEILRGIGVVRNEKKTAEKEEAKSGAPQSEKKAKAARVISTLLFLAAVAAVVFLTDALIRVLRFWFSH